MGADHEPDLMIDGGSLTDGAHVEGCGEVLSAHGAGVAPGPQTTKTTTRMEAPRAITVMGADAGRKRAKRPHIDYDAKIQEAAINIKEMGKAMAAAKSAQKNERRKKQRLVKKASALSPEDLERIAVLKRCGLFVAAGRDAIAAPSGGPTTAGGDATRESYSTSSGSSGVDAVGTASVCSTSSKLHIEADTDRHPEDIMAGGLE
jgi:hypothetical protein